MDVFLRIIAHRSEHFYIVGETPGNLIPNYFYLVHQQQMHKYVCHGICNIQEDCETVNIM